MHMTIRHPGPRTVAGRITYKEILVFAALVLFFIVSLPGNRSEADDGYHYAFQVKTQTWAQLMEPRFLLFLPISRLCYNFLQLLGLHPDAYTMMCVLSALCSAGAIMVCYRLMRNVLQLEKGAALWGCAFLLFSYGYWRYSVEAEIYSISNLLCVYVLYLIFTKDSPRMTLLAGFLAGLAVLIYKPNAMPLFFAFPFAYLIRRRWAGFFVYPLTGGVIILLGYLMAYQYVKPEGSYLNFLAAGASRSYGSPLVTLFVVLSNIAATQFLYGIDAIENFIRHKFPANIIVEEVFAANANGIWSYIAVGTLGLVALSMLLLLISAIRHFSRQHLRKEHAILLWWVIVYTLVLLFLDPNSPEPWTMLLLPIMLLVTCTLIAPLFTAGLTKLPWAVIIILFVHNVIGGYKVIAREDSDYIVNQCGWLKGHAQKGDLIITLGSGSMIAYFAYHVPAEVCAPEKVFDLCVDKAQAAIAAGKKVYLTENMLNRDDAIKFRHPEAVAKVAAFMERFRDSIVVANPGDTVKYAKVLELRARGPLH